MGKKLGGDGNIAGGANEGLRTGVREGGGGKDINLCVEFAER